MEIGRTYTKSESIVHNHSEDVVLQASRKMEILDTIVARITTKRYVNYGTPESLFVTTELSSNFHNDMEFLWPIRLALIGIKWSKVGNCKRSVDQESSCKRRRYAFSTTAA